MNRNKGRMGTIFALGTALAAVASFAWACSPQSTIFPTGPQSGAAGSRIAVQGTVNASGSAEIRWNSSTGPVIGSTPLTGNSFSIEATIPPASPGVYYMVLVAANNTSARAAFEVVPASPTSPAAEGATPAHRVSNDLWSGFGDNSASSLPQATAPASVTNGPSAGLTAGLTLFVAGLGGLSAGAVLSLRRRRAAASSNHL